MMEELVHKAEVLMEALPYIQKFSGKIAVVKFGGSAMEKPDVTQSTMRDIVLLQAIGMKVVVVHGGGKAITARLKELDIPTKFINGLRVTCERTIKVVDEILHDVVNRALIQDISICGGTGVQISGKKILRCEKSYSKDLTTGESIDIGFVGRVISVDPKPILDALDFGVIPVLTPLATDFHGQPYNINADIAACEVAKALHSEKLVFLSDVPGVLRDPSNENDIISIIHVNDISKLIADGILSGGMIPKIQSSANAIENGVTQVHMIDGRKPHSLLLEIFTDKGVGTQIVA